MSKSWKGIAAHELKTTYKFDKLKLSTWLLSSEQDFGKKLLDSKHVLKVCFKPSFEFFFPVPILLISVKNGHWSCFLFLFFFSFHKIWFYTTGYIRLWSNNIGCFGIWQISYCKIVLIKAWTIHVFAANIGQKMSTLFWSRFYLFIYDDFGHSTWGPRLPPH